MTGWILKVRGWLIGRKTYLAGGALLAVALGGIASGRLGFTMAVAIGGYGLTLCGISAKSNRQHQELLAALGAAAAAGLAFRTGGLQAAVAAGEKALPELVEACKDSEASQ